MQEKKVILMFVVLFLFLSFLQTYTMITLTGKATGEMSFCVVGAPNITAIPDQNATVGRVFFYAVNCSSDCGEPRTFYGTPIPNEPEKSLDSFFINSSTGEINFTPQSGEEGGYTVFIQCDKIGFSPNSTSFILTVNPAFGPSQLIGTLNADNVSVDLNWTNVSADNYTIYYSSNISNIMALDLDNLPSSNLTKIENLTELNWTDTNASQVQKRYYTVSATKNGIESLTSDVPVGKFTYYYTAPSSDVYGTLASNRISLYLNVTYTAETFLQEMPASLNPTISRLDKSNASGEYLTTHVRGLADGNIYDLEISKGYQITVDNYFNQTIVGKVYGTPYILQYDIFNSSVYGILATNWQGIFDFNKTYKAESFLQEIPASLNPTISRLDKTNASGEYLTTHVGGLADGNDFDMDLGVGYTITIDEEYNYTLCTNCFG